MVYRIADRLHKTVHELGEMPYSEFIGWLAYFKIIGEEK